MGVISADTRQTVASVRSGLFHLTFHKFMSKCDFLHPSIAHEGTGRAVLKERACGHTAGKSVNPDRLVPEAVPRLEDCR